MRNRNLRLVFVAVGCCFALLSPAFGQSKNPTPQQIDKLIQNLNSPDQNVRLDAVNDLGAMGPAAASAVPRIVELLKDKENGTRLAAVSTLGGIGSSAVAAAPALAAALKDGCPGVRWYAAEALGKIGTAAASAIPALIRALKEEDSVFRYYIAESLGEMGFAAAIAVPSLIGVLLDEDKQVPCAAAIGMGNIAANVEKNIPKMDRPMLAKALMLWQEAETSLDRLDIKTMPRPVQVAEAEDAVQRLVKRLEWANPAR